MKKATITTVLQGCKGPQGRTRLAVLIGGVAMLLLLLLGGIGVSPGHIIAQRTFT